MRFYKRVIALTLVAIMLVSIAVFAEDTTQETIYLKQGETYSFTNVGEGTSNVEYDKNSDYVIYDADGSVYKNKASSSSGTVRIPSGGKLLITAADSYVNITYDNNAVSSQKEEVRAFEKIVLSESPVYSFKNISDEKRTLYTYGKASGERIPYVLYDAYGNLAEYDTTKDWSSMDIQAGYTLKLKGTAVKRTLKTAFMSNSFEVKKEYVPFFVTTYFEEGESYSFKNISDSKSTLFSSGGDRDWRLFDANGNIVEETIAGEWGSGGYVKKEIPAGYTIELTLTHGIEVNTLNGVFSIEKKEIPPVKWVRIFPGNTYSFTNKDNVTHNLVECDTGANDMYKDSVIYDKSGNVVAQEIKQRWETKAIAPGQTIKITTRYRTSEIGIFTDQFDCKHKENPAYIRSILRSGDKYSFKNISNNELPMFSDAYGKYEIYDASGNLVASEDEVSINGVSIKSGETMYVTAGGDGEYSVPWEDFLVEKISSPEESNCIDLECGKTYKITNNGTSRYTLSTYENEITYDYALYYSNGKLDIFGTNTGTLSISAGSYAIVSFHGNTSVYNSDTIVIEEVEGPPVDKWALEPFKIYSFENISEKTSADLSYGIPVVYVDYSAEDNLPTSSGLGSGTQLVAGKHVIENQALESIAYAPHGYIKFSVETDIAYKRAEFNRGESGKIVNNSSVDYRLQGTDGIIDYVIYNKDGSVNSFSHKGGEPWQLPANTYAEFTALDYVNIIYPSEYAECEKISSEVVTYTTVSAGETIVIKNINQTQTVMYVVADKYDYVKYDKDGKITSGTINASSNLYKSNVILDANEKITITSYETDFTIIAPKDTIKTEKREYPAIYAELVMPEKIFSFKNTYKEDVTINCSGNEISYTIYDGDDNEKTSKSSVYVSSVVVKPNYRVEITNLYDDAVAFAGPFEHLRKDVVIVDDFKITRNGDVGTVKISAWNIPQSAGVLAAVYSDDNKMVGIKTLQLDEDGVYSGDVSLKDAAECRAFIWGGGKSFNPLCGESRNSDIAE